MIEDEARRDLRRREGEQANRAAAASTSVTTRGPLALRLVRELSRILQHAPTPLRALRHVLVMLDVLAMATLTEFANGKEASMMKKTDTSLLPAWRAAPDSGQRPRPRIAGTSTYLYEH